MKGKGCGLFYDTILEFSWRNWRIPQTRYYLWAETQGPNIQHITQQYWQLNLYKLVFL